MILVVKFGLALSVGTFLFLVVEKAIEVPAKYRRWVKIETRLLDGQEQKPAIAVQKWVSEWLLRTRLIKSMIKPLRNAGFENPEKLAFHLAISGLGVFAVSMIWLGSLLKTMAFLAVAVLAIYVWVQRRLSERIEEFGRQLPLIFKQIAGGLSAGMSIQQAIRHTVEQVNSPGREELRTVVEQVSLGMSLDEALDRMYQRMPLNELKMVIMGLSIQRRAGGNLIKMIELTVAAIEEKRRLKKNLEIQTAQAKLSAKVIGSLPFLILIGVMVIDPSYMEPLFTTSAGLTMLSVSIAAEFMGFLLLGRILEVKI